MDIFKIFLKPFNWKVSSLLAAAYVGCSASRLYKSLETQTALNIGIFHLVGTRVCFQNK